ncbi:MAG: 50S ribosomal protein L37e [Candidatus Altiarchaeota archaeon]|nr:50S ribosomal protein L37e [Candidatus Altiarchaeota archaeon]
MSKGTPSFGKRSSGKTHIVCRRCGSRSYNARKSVCAQCGFGRLKKLRTHSWKK